MIFRIRQLTDCSINSIRRLTDSRTCPFLAKSLPHSSRLDFGSQFDFRSLSRASVEGPPRACRAVTQPLTEVRTPSYCTGKYLEVSYLRPTIEEGHLR